MLLHRWGMAAAGSSVLQSAVEDMVSSGAFDEVRKAVSPDAVLVAVSMMSAATILLVHLLRAGQLAAQLCGERSSSLSSHNPPPASVPRLTAHRRA